MRLGWCLSASGLFIFSVFALGGCASGGAEDETPESQEQATLLEYGEPNCVDDTQCVEGLSCFIGGSRTFCTFRCSDDAECPADPGQCNNKGFCKAPGGDTDGGAGDGSGGGA